MGHWSFRSLLLAAIISNSCISWTASRHHFTHNVAGHRSRHRRQGAGLYLPASYVIPGGEGSGAWGEWGEVSPCSRTCGGGVASQKRICLEIGSNGKPLCRGGDTKYFSCSTQDCPDGSEDFRAEQCAEFNDKSFKGVQYDWIPYTRGMNPCELNCRPRGERFYYRHRQKVIDGTRCTDESFDVCVDGECQAVGCDMMLGSNSREDKCRVCRGNGTDCHTFKGVLDSQDLIKGYNDIMLIPEGSTSINIVEVRPSNNYLALRSKHNNVYYLNGDYHIDFPRPLVIAGAVWHYERNQMGFNAPDMLRCQGPTNEPLYLSLLLQGQNVGIKYEYSVPIRLAPMKNKYNWVHEEFSECTTTCGGGFKSRNVTCRKDDDSLEIVDDSLCEAGLKPATNQTCNTEPCPPTWVEDPWGPCSKRCGEGGTQSRVVQCKKIITNGFASVVADKECFDLLGPKPELFRKCNEDAVCPTWFTGPWRPCDKLCDEGKQSRQVICHQRVGGRVEILSEEECEEEKPLTEQTCVLKLCDGVDWVTTEWIGCDTCLSKVRTRTAKCAIKTRKVVNDSFCAHHKLPALEEPCDPVSLPACTTQWYATQWSNCSVECGKGTKSRLVFCGKFDGAGVMKVEDNLCDAKTKYNDTAPCEVPPEKCPAKWFAGPWSECDKPCNGGEQHRRVMCFNGNKESDCDPALVLDSTQTCNTGPCTKDEVFPVVSSMPVIDEEEECIEDKYPGVGVGEEGSDSSSEDTTYSDYSSTEDFGSGSTSSEFTTEYGSGSGATGDTDYSDHSTSELDSIETEVYKDVKTGKPFKLPTDIIDSEGEDYSTEETNSAGTDTGSPEYSETPSTENEYVYSTENEMSESSEATSTEDKSTIDVSAENDYTASTDYDSSSEITGSETPVSENTENTINITDITSKNIFSEETKITDSETGGTSESPKITASEPESTNVIKSKSTESRDTDNVTSLITDTSDLSTTDTTAESTEKIISITTETSESNTLTTIESETGETSESPKVTGTSEYTSDISSVSYKTESESTDVTVPESTESEETAATLTTTESDIPESSDSTKVTETSEHTSDKSTVSDKTDSESTDVTEPESTESRDTDNTGSDVTDTSDLTTTDAITETTEEMNSITTEISELDTLTTTESGIKSETGETSESIETEVSGTTPLASIETTLPEETNSNSPFNTEPTKPKITGTIAKNTTDSETTEPMTPTEPVTEGTSALVTIETTELGTMETTESTTIKEIEPKTMLTTKSELTESTTIGITELSSTAELTTDKTKADGTTELLESTTSAMTDSEPTETPETVVSTEAGTAASNLITETTGVAETTGSTEAGSTDSSVVTEFTSFAETTGSAETGSTDSSVVTESTDVTDTTVTTEAGSTDSSAVTEPTSVTEATGSTETGSTDSSAVTEPTETPTGGVGTSPWTLDTVTTKKIKTCKPRRKPSCSATKFGCCPDKKTEAHGPFDEGCDTVKTCKETKFGCCPDGVSPATGTNNDGCPVSLCNETLYGCCLSDNRTAAEGNDQEGCPPPPPACHFSQFGCCPDGETEAKGSSGEDCMTTVITETTMISETISEKGSSATETEITDKSTEFTEIELTSTLGATCIESEFGCCPDGVSPAGGAQMEGCVISCNTSTYGCCPDGESPAHGPEHEGCCLNSIYGCCPDNYKDAEGPHLEGCGCQYAHYGCCPDNETIARGPNKEGCGCQYTQHGCCPDRHTEASGPAFEGCGCHTYQFGCCPDGISPAQGPRYQGCRCQDTKFGCCGDGQTVAAGPDFFGCDCSSSEFGCCPDGKTAAQGNKFMGCTDMPENKQAACSLAIDRGSCRNFTVQWYFEPEYGGCSRFWYGGCDGNGNRFSNEDECKDVCVNPPPKDACKLPKVKGSCTGDYRRWYYDSRSEQCAQFIYGGCLGNANNFETREACQQQCEPPRSEDQCELPVETGPCAGTFSRWGFNKDNGRCEQFIWGGCEGNNNRFSSEAACIQRCSPPGVQKAECSLPQDVGNCTEKQALWSFIQSENRCMPFYYSGCGGNNNRFESEHSCLDSCPSYYEPDMCTLPALVGECADYKLKWYFDTGAQRCRQYYYGGCGGNGNSFETEEECEGRCSPQSLTTTAGTSPRPEEYRPEFCFSGVDPGPCNEIEPRWAYDTSRGVCIQFEFGGCGGNRNNFPTLEHCQFFCNASQDVCQLPMRSGPCDDSQMKWFYDKTNDACSRFAYGGCDGNDNRFDTEEQCERRCKTGPAHPEPAPTRFTGTPTIAPTVFVPQQCRTSSALEPCAEEGVVWYLDTYLRECVAFQNAPEGDRCRRSGVFPTREECEYACAEYPDLITHPTVRDACQQESDPGNCGGYFVKWYYDSTRDGCNQFVFTGCGGNNNRFETREECEGRCSQAAVTVPTKPTTSTTTTTTTTTASTPLTELPPIVQDQCRTPESLEPCGRNITAYYYDYERGVCQAGYIGDCHYANRYRSEEECERTCGHFKDLDVCKYRLDPGPCRNKVYKYYWDELTGNCLRYVYGGCGGGPNRFSTGQECEDICGHRGNEVLPDCDRYNEECEQLSCEYGVHRTRTVDGCERCSCVQVERDCTPLKQECEKLVCTYGMARTVEADGCERCTCTDHPCVTMNCPENERCVPIATEDPETRGPRYSAVCRIVNKPGTCPPEGSFNLSSCRTECYDDADCRESDKCCARGCSQLCLEPYSLTTLDPQTTHIPDLPHAPVVNTETKPEVTAQEGGKATLRCLFHSNPPPKITWRRGELTIDGNVDRYRLLSDGALEIVSLYRNDSGVYICVADNGLGVAEQEVRLQVNDPVEEPAGISGEQNAVVEGTLGGSIYIRCLAYGYPPPSVTWYRGLTGPMVPFSSKYYEARGNVLLIRKLNNETMGEYACQAYNGKGKAASWTVTVQARHQTYPVEPPSIVVVTPRETQIKTTITTLRTVPTVPEIVTKYTVPVTARIVAEQTTVPAGSQLNLRCEIDGYPEPSVYWVKDGATLVHSDRIHIYNTRLTVTRVNVNDNGLYECTATNEYSSHSSSVQITVEGLFIPPYCRDNPMFANCSLIVRSKYCKHRYYSTFCCKSCAQAGQLDPEDLLRMQADEPIKNNK